MGETLRRLAAKVLVAKYQGEAAAELAPLQVSVGQPGATEAIIYKVREWARSAPAGHALLTIDFSNAYNTLNRTAMLSAIAARCPRFLPYAEFCYGSSTPLLTGDEVIQSCAGTQQGDACGPLFFSVTAHRAATAANVPGLSWAHWFLDDGALSGPVGAVAEALQALEPVASSVGLRLNRAKCKLWGPTGGLGALGDDCPPSLADIPWASWTAGIRVLGTPVGRASYRVLTEISAKIEQKLERL